MNEKWLGLELKYIKDTLDRIEEKMDLAIENPRYIVDIEPPAEQPKKRGKSNADPS